MSPFLLRAPSCKERCSSPSCTGRPSRIPSCITKAPACAIDETLLDAADIHEYEQIQIYNVTNGERFTTYAIRAARDSGIISVNGAAAHKANPGDLIIIATFASYNELELARYAPELVYVDADNRIMDTRQAIPVQAA